MCVYCMTGDTIWKYDPPFWPKPNELLPDPNMPIVPAEPYAPYPWAIRPFSPPNDTITVPYEPWNVQKLKDHLEILKQIKALEDKLGCPCEPNKADHIKLLEDRIAVLENLPELPKKNNPDCKCKACKCDPVSISDHIILTTNATSVTSIIPTKD